MILDEIDNIQTHFDQVKSAFKSNVTKDMKFRKRQLKQLIKGM